MKEVQEVGGRRSQPFDSQAVQTFYRIGAFEYPPLLRNRFQHRIERGAFVEISEPIERYFGNDLLEPPPDRPEVFQPLLPAKPSSIRRRRIVTPDWINRPSGSALDTSFV